MSVTSTVFSPPHTAESKGQYMEVGNSIQNISAKVEVLCWNGIIEMVRRTPSTWGMYALVREIDKYDLR